ncbi:hypothetical protein C1H46_009275, partial [Malus baccata]
PADQFASLQSGFRRQLPVGLGRASVVVLGADFLGVTSFFLGLSPESSRSQADFLGLSHRRLQLVHCQFSLILPRLMDGHEMSVNPLSHSARLPPPESAMLASLCRQLLLISTFGGPKEVGEAVVRTVTGSRKRPDIKGTLIESKSREDSVRNVKCYELEFRVESPLFHQQNIAVCCFRFGRLFTQCSGTGISMAGGEVRPAILVRLQQYSGRQSHSYRRKV